MSQEVSGPHDTLAAFRAEHEPGVHQAVCRMLCQAADGATTIAAWLPPGVGDLQVDGAFVTLRRQQQLRSCYGCFGGPYGLSPALQQASLGVATKDPRFPAVRVDELPQMHVEISLLFNIQPIAATGQSRREAVTVGRHGLTVRSAGQAGLLLPRVATDFRLDAEGFLVQVCNKAGLPAHTWLDETAELHTFETHCFGGVYVHPPAML